MNLSDISSTLGCDKKWFKLQQWFKTDLGQIIYQREVIAIEKELESCFGYNIVQLGQVSTDCEIKTARIKNKLVINCFGAKHPRIGQYNSTVSLLQRLSLKSNSIDVVVLHHCLEFEPFPHEILREVERVLVAEGKLLILTFNPFSLIGLWHFFLTLKSKVWNKNISFPLGNKWISSRRLEDWLALLGFDSEKVATIFFRPPINNLAVLDKLKFMDKEGARYWPFFSGSMLYKATKRVSTLTPIRPKWRLQEKVVTSSVPEIKVPREAKKETSPSRFDKYKDE